MAKQQAPKAAASNEGQSQKATKGHIVLSPFRDIANWDKAYEPGDDVSHFDKERQKKLVENGLVQAPKASVKPAETPNPSDTLSESGDAGDGGEGGDDPNGDEGDNGEE